jgi:hypothetical protein
MQGDRAMTRTTTRAAGLGLALLILAGCDGSDKPQNPMGLVAQQFGETFRRAFAQGPNDAPLDGDLTITFMGVAGPSKTAAPVDF